jgi:hypothetical protein
VGLLKRLRNEAHRRGLSFKAMLNRALHRGLEVPPGPAVRAFPTFAMGKATHPLDKALVIADALADEASARELV